MASLPEWGEWESAVRGWLRDPVVHLVQRGLVNPATGEPGKFKKCMEAGGRRAVGRIRHRRAALGTAPACIGP